MKDTEVVVGEEMVGTEESDALRIYEVGYHVIPSIAEENVGAVVAEIHAQITKGKGMIIGEDAPKMRELAYAIPKIVNGAKNIFKTAYFGAIKFESNSSVAVELQETLKSNEKILRYLIIKTVRENTMSSVIRAAANQAKADAEKEKAEGEGEVAPKPVVTEEEIDKTIDGLLA